MFMTEKKGGEQFDNKFHRQYVGGTGDLAERAFAKIGPSREIRPLTYEELLTEYRQYVKDPKAELPEEVLEYLRANGRA